MPKSLIIDNSMQVLKKALDLRERNHQLIVSNIANAETPGYQAKQLEFEKQLNQAANTSQLNTRTENPKHFSVNGSMEKVSGKVRTLSGSGTGGHGNTVNVDQQMITLAENQIAYEATINVLNKKLGMLKYVAQDGR
jgi:flagellar basal-body rod protein FlgB